MARLERQNRWFRVIAGLAVLAGGAALAMALSGGDAGGVGNFKQIDCGHLVIRDTDGQMRAWLGVAEGGPRLIFFDASGKELFRHQGFLSKEDILAKWREFGVEVQAK